jgi:hypothetical protein
MRSDSRSPRLALASSRMVKRLTNNWSVGAVTCRAAADRLTRMAEPTMKPLANTKRNTTAPRMPRRPALVAVPERAALAARRTPSSRML